MRLHPVPAIYTSIIILAMITFALCLIEKPHQPGSDIVILAQEYLGTPYMYGGASPAGFDCSGYIMFLFHQCGKDLPRTADKQATFGIAVSANRIQPGDLLCFASADSGDISHVGLYIGSRRFIHASSSARKVIISSLDEPYWQKALRAVRRIKNR